MSASRRWIGGGDGVIKWLEGLACLLILFGGLYGALLLLYGVAS